MDAEFTRALAAPLTETLAAAGTVILLWVGARFVVAGDLTGAEFVGFLGLSMKLYSPVKNVAKFPAIAQPGLIAAERIFEFLDTPAGITDREGAQRLSDFRSSIAFENVSFSYRPGEAVLSEISLDIARGDVVALVGRSGAGKTTLVDLLGRFIDVDQGRITVDGLDIRDVRIADLRSLMGVVSQETVLFHDTVRTNIAYGRPEASRDDVVRAATAAHAHTFIQGLAQGYETLVGERGVALSGGQRQRIALARALLRDPPILILDEATSSLDTESERLIQDATGRLMEGRTVLVIAHRLSTILSADQIVVMDRGRIVERGDHGTLMAQAGLYRRLYELQFDERAVVDSF
jgi:subfamily B ATP-binding cassette protein MsbA